MFPSMLLAIFWVIILNLYVWRFCFISLSYLQEFSYVQLLSSAQLFVNWWAAAWQASLSMINSWSLLKLMSINLVMSSSHLILCHHLFLLPSIFPGIRIFSNESVLHIRQPKYWSFSFNISPFNQHSGLISFRMDWLDLLSEDSRVFSNTIVQKHQYIGIQLSLYSTSRIHTWLLETFGKKILQEGEVVGWHHQLEVHEFE